MTVYSEFQPLKSVVVGRLFDIDEYINNLQLEEKWSKNFRTILTKATEELDTLVDVLTKRNIQVYRPEMYSMKYENGFRDSPLACRDWILKYGATVLVGNDAFKDVHTRVSSTDYIFVGNEQYRIPTFDIFSERRFDKFECEELPRPYMHMSNVLRYGKDIFISGGYEMTGNKKGMEYVINWFNTQDVRVHIVEKAIDHLDGHMHIVKPGIAISILPKSELPDFFKSWTIIECNQFDRRNAYGNTWAYQFKKLHPIIAKQYATFLEMNPEETMFDVSSLNIDENTVLIPGFDKKVFNSLEKLGVECISIDFRGISFFDCGIHCATSELAREGPCEDYTG